MLESVPFPTEPHAFDHDRRTPSIIPNSYRWSKYHDLLNLHIEDALSPGLDLTSKFFTTADIFNQSADESHESAVTNVIGELEDVLQDKLDSKVQISPNHQQESEESPKVEVHFNSRLDKLGTSEDESSKLDPPLLEYNQNSSPPSTLSDLALRIPPATIFDGGRDFIPLAPAPSSSSSKTSSLEIGGFEDPRIKKMELRKERNRESARRSSLKRSQMLKELKRDIADAKKRESELRKQDEKLRRENTALRSALYRRT